MENTTKRPVKFKKLIPAQYEDVNDESGKKLYTKPVKGTGCMEEDFNHNGVFHQWAAGYEEFESGPGNYTYAIVECVDGTITEVLPHHIQFI